MKSCFLQSGIVLTLNDFYRAKKNEFHFVRNIDNTEQTEWKKWSDLSKEDLVNIMERVKTEAEPILD
jgi:hypothetical protein